MKLRPMNKTLIILPEDNICMVDSKPIADALKSGLIELPEHNTIMKVSDHGKVIRAANDCYYPYRKNQRICFKNLNTTPVWYEESGKKYRLIKEWEVNWVYEDD